MYKKPDDATVQLLCAKGMLLGAAALLDCERNLSETVVAAHFLAQEAEKELSRAQDISRLPAGADG